MKQTCKEEFSLVLPTLYGFLLADDMIGIKQVYKTNLTQPYKSIDGWVNTISKYLFSVVQNR